MLYKNFIWDFDGTLCDSYPTLTDKYMEALEGCDPYPPYTREEINAKLKIMIPAADKILVPYCPDIRAKAGTAYHEYIKTHLLPPCKDAIRLCKSVCAAGGKNFLYTHSGNYVKPILEAYGILSCFTGLVTSEPPTPKFPMKPAPDAVLYIISEYRLDPKETVMIGDREIDVGSGLNAGIAAIMFDEDGYYPDTKAGIYVKALADMAKKCEIPLLP